MGVVVEEFTRGYYPCRNCGHQLELHPFGFQSNRFDCSAADCQCELSREEAAVTDRDEYVWIMNRVYGGDALVEALESYSSAPYTNSDLPIFEMTRHAAAELRELREEREVLRAAVQKARAVVDSGWKSLPVQARQELRSALRTGIVDVDSKGEV